MNKSQAAAITGRRQALRNAGKGYPVYHGTRPSYVVPKASYAEAVTFIGLSIIGGLATGWMLIAMGVVQ